MKKSLEILAVLLTVSTYFSSCNVEDEPFIVDNLFFVQFVIDGNTVRYEDGVVNYGNGPGIASFRDSLGRIHSQFTTFIRNILAPDHEDDVLTIQMVRFSADTAWPSYNTEFLLFDEGNYNYGAWNGDSTHLGIDGVVITYTDSDGTVWSSDAAYGSQTGSESFNINLHKAEDAILFGAKTKGTFNCRVFDGLGGFLDLGDGSFHARTIHSL